MNIVKIVKMLGTFPSHSILSPFSNFIFFPSLALTFDSCPISCVFFPLSSFPQTLLSFCLLLFFSSLAHPSSPHAGSSSAIPYCLLPSPPPFYPPSLPLLILLIPSLLSLRPKHNQSPSMSERGRALKCGGAGGGEGRGGEGEGGDSVIL